jgi:hypothetical protein
MEGVDVVIGDMSSILVQSSGDLVVGGSPEIVVSEITCIATFLPSFDHLSYMVSMIFSWPLYSASANQLGFRIPHPCEASQQKQHCDLWGKTSHLLFSTVKCWQAVVTLGMTPPQKRS